MTAESTLHTHARRYYYSYVNIISVYAHNFHSYINIYHCVAYV